MRSRARRSFEGGGWTIVDYTKVPPQIRGKWVRGEQVQADYLVQMLEIFDSLDFAGAYVYEFISPGTPHLPDPRHDLDIASFSVVKTIADDPGTSPRATAGNRSEPSAPLPSTTRLCDDRATP